MFDAAQISTQKGLSKRNIFLKKVNTLSIVKYQIDINALSICYKRHLVVFVTKALLIAYCINIYTDFFVQ